MKQFTMRQFGFGENCYRRDFVVEMPDDVDPAMLSEDSLRRLADIHYDESATAAVNTGTDRSNSEGAQR